MDQQLTLNNGLQLTTTKYIFSFIMHQLTHPQAPAVWDLPF
jgi:hypothetical protein